METDSNQTKPIMLFRSVTTGMNGNLEHGVRYMNLQTMYLLALLNPGCLRKYKLKVRFIIHEGYTSLLFIVWTSSSSADMASSPSSPYSKKYKDKVFTKVA
jgi:hypothetical protein